MQILISEWLACILVLLMAARPKPGAWWRIGVALSIIATLAVAWLGSARWLMLPATLGGLSLLPMEALNPGWRLPIRLAAAAGSIAAAFFCWLFPMPEMPSHSGRHAVGTRTIEIAARHGQPALMLQIWYPAEPDPSARRAPWLTDPGLAPPFPFDRISSALSGSVEDAPAIAAKEKFKVLFYEHAWMGHRGENLFQIEDLASEGFVVVAIDHPGQSRRILHPDGAVVKGMLPELPDFSSLEAVSAFEDQAERCLASREQDLIRAREALSHAAGSDLTGRLDLDHLGIFGFSFGGTTAIRVCARQSFFRAGANLDGFFLGEPTPEVPFLFMEAEPPAWLADPPQDSETAEQTLIRRSELRTLEALEGSHHERIILDGAKHESFSDRIFLSAMPGIARAGDRRAGEVRSLIHERLSELFRRVL